jgi:hypothetical protein
MTINLCAADDGGLVVWINGAENPSFGGDHASFLKYIGGRADELLKAANHKDTPVKQSETVRELRRAVSSRSLADNLVALDAE